MKKIYGLQTMRQAFTMLLLFLFSTGFSIANNMQSDKETKLLEAKVKVTSGTISSVFDQIVKQQGVEFFYNTNTFDAKRKITISKSNPTIKEVLTIALGDGFTYTLRDKHIMIAEKKSQSRDSGSKLTLVRGVVKDAKGDPLPGVSILVKGTTEGVSTENDGSFILSVLSKPGVILVFRYLGMKTQEVVYSGKDLTVTMEDDSKQLGEVVISTGYQNINIERMTGAAEVVTAKDIVNKGYMNVEDVLKGRFAGVTTIGSSGRPGAQASIRIRGINALDGSTEPMWIVDGMPLQGDVPSVSMGGTEFTETVLTSGLANIPPDDIESITVLKDAAATAIYGARAANGVIVITTKRGVSGKSTVNASFSYGITEAPTNKLQMMNTRQKNDFERGIYEDFPGIDIGGRVYQILKNIDGGALSREQGEAEINRLSRINTNWFKEIFQTGHEQSHNVSIRGGDDRTRYYGSLAYQGTKGIIPNNNLQNITGALKFTHDFRKWLRVNFDIRTSYQTDKSTASAINPLNYATFANTYERPYNENRNYEYDRSYAFEFSQIQEGQKYDINILEDLNRNESRSNYMSNQMALSIEATILPGLMISTSGTFSNTATHTTQKLMEGTYTSKLNSWLSSFFPEMEVSNELNNGRLNENTRRVKGWMIRNEIKYAKSFFEEKLHVNLFGGHEVSENKYSGFQSLIPEWSEVYGVGSYPDIAGMLLNTTSAGAIYRLGGHNEGQDRGVSIFANGSFSFEDRYIVAGSIRMDGADIIGTQNRFHPLWNISGRWNLHKERFMESLPFINILSLRTSYGFTGTIDRNATPFSYMQKVEGGSFIWDGVQVMDRYYPGNPSIKWQKKEDISLGLDVSMMDSRLNLTVEYYDTRTRDLLGQGKLPASSGKQELMANMSSVANKGWDISLRTMNINTNKFTWITSFNISFNKDKITEAYYKDLSEVSASTNSSFSSMYNLRIQGMPIRSYYGYQFAGINPMTGGTLVYVDGVDNDGNPLGTLNEEGRYVYDMDQGLTQTLANASRQYIGRSDPSITGGFNTQFNIGRFSLSAHFTFMADFLARSYQSISTGTAYNSSKNLFVEEQNRWRKPGDITNVAKYGTGRTEYVYQLLDFRFEKGDFLKCNNISIGYNLPNTFLDKLGLLSARINFHMSNVFTLTKFRGIDPENQGMFSYPNSRAYKCSLSLNF